MMQIIVAQKHMNLPRLIVVAFSAIALALSGNLLGAEVAQTQPGKSRRTFADWCRQKAALSPETKHTVDVLLKEAETTNCDVADQNLSLRSMLDLSDNKISDIKPLASLTNLELLSLNDNKISDIKPLASLTKLTFLTLDKNQLIDVKPLASLTNLTQLWLAKNQIIDVKPLASLTKLRVLHLSDNKIRDIKPLASLTKVIILELGGNPIAPKNCPLKADFICSW
jgi:internalin A